MAHRIFTTLALVGAVGLLPACPGDSGTTDDPSTGNNPTATGTATDTPTGTSGDDPTGAAVDTALCTNFGGQTGVEAVIGSFVGKVLADDKINAYFLTTDTDGGNLVSCLSTQVGAAVGCAGVVYSCMDMKTAHAGMGISDQDFTDLATDFVAAMNEVATLTDADKAAVVDVLTMMHDDIVEDDANNVTIYQRLGRKPGIQTVIGGLDDPMSFISLVATDASINTFFNPATLDRLKTCLVRQVAGATAGGEPLGTIYGKEVDAPPGIDPGVSADKPCVDMVKSHATLKDGMGVGIEKADFDALVGHLLTAMTNYDVSQDDQNSIEGVLSGLCSSIVTVDPGMC